MKLPSVSLPRHRGTTNEQNCVPGEARVEEKLPVVGDAAAIGFEGDAVAQHILGAGIDRKFIDRGLPRLNFPPCFCFLHATDVQAAGYDFSKPGKIMAAYEMLAGHQGANLWFWCVPT